MNCKYPQKDNRSKSDIIFKNQKKCKKNIDVKPVGRFNLCQKQIPSDFKLAEAFLAYAEGDLEKGRKLWKDTLDYASRGEDSVQDAFDVHMFNIALRRKFEERPSG